MPEISLQTSGNMSAETQPRRLH